MARGRAQEEDEDEGRRTRRGSAAGRTSRSSGSLESTPRGRGGQSQSKSSPKTSKDSSTPKATGKAKSTRANSETPKKGSRSSGAMENKRKNASVNNSPVQNKRARRSQVSSSSSSEEEMSEPEETTNTPSSRGAQRRNHSSNDKSSHANKKVGASPSKAAKQTRGTQQGRNKSPRNAKIMVESDSEEEVERETPSKKKTAATSNKKKTATITIDDDDDDEEDDDDDDDDEEYIASEEEEEITIDSDDSDVVMEKGSDSDVEEISDGEVVNQGQRQQDDDDESPLLDTSGVGLPLTVPSILKASEKLAKAYQLKLKRKEEEIMQLKNLLKLKDQQLEQMNEISVRNLELVSKLNLLLSDREFYEGEVKAAAKKGKNAANDKSEGTKVEKQSANKQREGSHVTEEIMEIDDSTEAKSTKPSEKKTQETKVGGKTKESVKGAKNVSVKKDDTSESEEEEDSEKKEEKPVKRTSGRTSKKQEEKHEEMKESEEEEESTPKKGQEKGKATPKKGRGKVKDKDAEEDKPKVTRRRSRRGKKDEEEDEEDIEKLFVKDLDEKESDEEDDDEEEDKKKKKGGKNKSKKDKESPKKEEEKVETEKQETTKDEEKKEAEEDEDDDTSKGRHNIRKLMTTKKLTEETKQAAKDESERRARVEEQHKEHVRETINDPKTKIPITTKLALAVKPDKKKTPIVEVNAKLIRKLKPHQVQAVEFMWDCVIESIPTFKKGDQGSGCILAHCMGLGKTLSVITLVHTLMMSRQTKFKTCLVVCPLNTVLNWKNEWSKWLLKKDQVDVYELASARDLHERAELLDEWRQEGGVMIMGYQIFRILVNSTTKSKKKKAIYDKSLIDPGPDIVICDEGHILKNDASAISKAMARIRTKRRIVLTGTPLQNNLAEYHCMVDFVKPNLLGTRREFSNRFVNPITNGQHSDSTPRDVKLMKKRAHILHEMLAGCVQRKDYSEMVKFLPPKYEYVIAVRLSEKQILLYEKYLEKYKSDNSGSYVGVSLFSDYQNLMRIWTHPRVLKLDETRKEKQALFEVTDSELETTDESASESEEEEEVLDDDISESSSSSGIEIDSDSSVKEIPLTRTRRTRGQQKIDKEDKDDDVKKDKKDKKRESQKKANGVKDNKKGKNKSDEKNKKNGNKSGARLTNGEASKDDEENGENRMRRSKVRAGEVIKQWRSHTRKGSGSDDDIEIKKVEQWWTAHVPEEEMTKMEFSGKIILMFEVLRLAESLGDKVLIFSQSILSLDLIELFLAQRTEEVKAKKPTKKNPVTEVWEKDEDYIRMDGSTTATNRTRLTKSFNDPKNKRLRLFLISTRAGGLGINLDCANRVIIFDASWNPSHDIQSIFRVYRFGQEKECYIYRFLAQGTMEEKIYDRQISKESLSQRVIDENQLDRHFTQADLAELYRFTPDRLDDPNRKERPTPKLPDDMLLRELLVRQKEWIVGYHEHDSLLEKRPEEDLTEEERKAAWAEYEAEKKGLYQYVPQTGSTMYTTNLTGNMINAMTNIRPYYQNNYYAANSSLYRHPFVNYNPTYQNSVPVQSQLVGQVGSQAPSPMVNIQMPGGQSNSHVAQLPRVVQEILKYNPSISPADLQSRLQSFLGMHNKYTPVPAFSVPATLGAIGAAAFPSQTNMNPLSAASGAPMLSQARPVLSTASVSTGQLQPVAVPAQQTFSDMPSRLPQPGHVPANNLKS